MARMHVADFETGAVARKTARPQCGETALVGQLRQRVGLIHELRELAAREEVADHAGERLRVDQLRRRHILLVKRHALADQTLGTQQAGPALVLKQFADRADTTGAEVVDIIDLAAGVTQLDQHLRRRHQVLRVEHALGQRNILLEPLVQFVTADRAEVVTAVVEEEPLDQQLRIVDVGRVARTHAAVDLLQRVLLVADLVLAHAADQVVVAVGDISELDLLDPGIDQLLQVVFSQLYELIDHHDVVIAGDVVDRVEAGEILLLQQLRNRVLPDLVALRQDIAVGRIADRAQEGRDVELPAAAATVEVDENEVVDVELHIHPRAAVRNDPVRIKRPP